MDPGSKNKEDKNNISSRAEAKMAQELAMEIALGMDGKKQKIIYYVLLDGFIDVGIVLFDCIIQFCYDDVLVADLFLESVN